MRKKQTKKTIVVKMEFDLVDWIDDTHVPEFSEVASTLKVISMYKQAPESFTKSQTKVITSWLNNNSIEKFVKAKNLAEKHQALLAEDAEFADALMWTKRINTNH
jgi:hypothetical protein